MMWCGRKRGRCPLCSGCWESYGSPELDSPEIQACRELIEELYRFPEGGVGGNLHIVTDDWNIEDGNLEFCRDQVLDESYGTPDQREVELQILDLMDRMSLAERASVLRRVRI